MKILVAEDSPTFRKALRSMLTRWDYDVVTAEDGEEAWAALQEPDGPKLAIVDWDMPKMDGIEICRRVRKQETGDEDYTYLILLTAKDSREDAIKGLNAGADDYITKPFDEDELKVRVGTGARLLRLQANLTERVRELEDALAKIKTLDGLVPICAACKRVREDDGYWKQVETYVQERSTAEFTHGTCPECVAKLYPDLEV